MSESGAFLIIRTQAPDARFREFAAASVGSGTIISSTRLHEVAVLEPGSLPLHTLVIEFDSRQEALNAHQTLPFSTIDKPVAPQVLLTGKVPDGGFDDPAIPTRANVSEVPNDGPVLLLIEGSASDQDAMDAYRNIILPMMFERHAYYTVFELGGNVEVLSGEWNEAIFAISRWPSAGVARDFWLSERYQDDAIPLRLEIGRFGVSMVPDQS